MNDFTKDELLIILEGLFWRDNHINPNQRSYKLHGKIQSKIDNYCEHEKTRSVSDVDYVEICIDCNELKGWI